MTSVSPLGNAAVGGKPVPAPRGEEKVWFEAAAEGWLALTRCRACSAYWVTRVVCPSCWSTEVETVRASGRGEIYSFTILHRAGRPGFEEDVPYVVALVELEEGPRVLTRIADVEPDDVRIGQPVRVAFAPYGDFTVPVFGVAAR